MQGFSVFEFFPSGAFFHLANPHAKNCIISAIFKEIVSYMRMVLMNQNRYNVLVLV